MLPTAVDLPPAAVPKTQVVGTHPAGYMNGTLLLANYLYSIFNQKLGVFMLQPKSKKAAVESILHCQQNVLGKKKLVLADYHPNKQVGGSRIIPKCRGKIYPEVVTNGYEIHGDSSITGPAAFDRPLAGFTTLAYKPDIEFDVNVARAIGVDGFLVEWGFPNAHSSSDKILIAMQDYLASKPRDKGNKFTAVPMFIPTWLAKSGERISAGENQQRIKQKLHEMVKKYYNNNCPRANKKPLLFFLNFYDTGKSHGIPNEGALKEIFASDPLLKDTAIAFRMSKQDSRWKIAKDKQVVGDVPWIPPRTRSALSSGNSFISDNFHGYANQADVARHAKDLNKLHDRHKKHLPMKVASVNPGMDTRAAPWSRCNTFIAREENGTNTFKNSWQAARSLKPDLITVNTFNDFQEGTHIQPSVNEQSTAAEINAEQSCLFKGGSKAQCTQAARKAKGLISQAQKLRNARVRQDELKSIYTSTELRKLTRRLDHWSNSIYKRKLEKAIDKEHSVNGEIAKLNVDRKQIDLNDIPVRRVGQSQTEITLKKLLDPSCFSNEGAFTKGNIVLNIKRADPKAKSPILITFKSSGKTHTVSEYYVASDVNEKTVRLPLNTHTRESFGKLKSQYKLNHKGFEVTVKNVHVDNQKRKIKKHS